MRRLGFVALACWMALAGGTMATAETIFVTTSVGGEIHRIQSRTGHVTTIAPGGPPWYGDLVLDAQGLLYTGAFLEHGVKRLDTATSAFLPDVATNLCAPLGLSIAPTGDLFVNVGMIGCPAAGVWRVPGRTASLAVPATPPYTQIPGATAFLRVGPFGGHLIALDAASRRVVRAAPPSFDVPVDFITLPPADSPVALAVSPSDGDVFVTLLDSAALGGSIRRYGPDGLFKHVFSDDIAAGRLAFDARGNLYVSEIRNDLVLRLTPDGTKTVVTDRIPGVLGMAVGPTFLDAPLNHFANAAIETIVDAGLTVGCATAPPLFCPEAAVTREEMAAFIIRALGEHDPPVTGFERFDDVPPTSPFFRFIDRLAELGITSGCGARRYCPGAPVSREQMAAVILRALGEFDPPQPATQRFLDVPPASPFYRFIDRLAGLGIAAGCTPTRYCPGDPVTRAQMAVFLTRAFGL
jgi:hypothetical protein